MMKIKKILKSLLMFIGLTLSSCVFDFELKTSNNLPNFDSYSELSYKLEDMYANSYYQNCLPSSGNSNILIIPVLFTDSNIDTKKVRADIETTFFGESEEMPWESVSSFYYKESLKQVKLSGTVLDWYLTGRPASYYGPENEGQDRTIDLLISAVNDAVFKKKISLNDFDSNKDGYIDSVVMIYGYNNYSTLKNNAYKNLWAYTNYTLGDPNKEEPTPNIFMWASYDFMYANDGSLDAHTYIHETGHLFGLDDYYDYNGKYKPAGGWGMQDENIGSHDPLSRLLLGWFRNVAIVRGTGVGVEISSIEKGDIIIVSNDFVKSPFDTFYIIDYYTLSGLNEYDAMDNKIRPELTSVVKEGCRIWHADARLVNFNVKDGEAYLTIPNPITTNPNVDSGYVMFGNSNTSTKKGIKKRSYIGENYLLRLVKNHDNSIPLNDEPFRASDLFMDGDTFSFRGLSITATFSLSEPSSSYFISF